LYLTLNYTKVLETISTHTQNTDTIIKAFT
jgi:hypothetical protein